MRKIFAIIAVLSATLTLQAQVQLKTEGLDTAYVQNIIKRSQKIVDGLGLTDAQKAEDVRNIIANRYFLLNEIHEQCAKTKQFARDSITAPGRQQHVTEGAERRRDAALYQHHFEFASALSTYLSEAQIEAVKDGMTFGVVKFTSDNYFDMIPSLTEEERTQIMAWLKEAREYAMDAENSNKKHNWFKKYKGRINNWLSARGYDINKEREAWNKRLEERKAKGQQ